MDTRTGMILTTLVAVVACEFPSRELQLGAGERCDDADECLSGHCERSSEDDAARRMCCTTDCPDGTWCHPSGSHCVGCQGAACLDGCGGDVDCELSLGTACSSDEQCRSSSCDLDIAGVRRCCEAACADEERGCRQDGVCECFPGERWSGFECEGLNFPDVTDVGEFPNALMSDVSETDTTSTNSALDESGSSMTESDEAGESTTGASDAANDDVSADDDVSDDVVTSRDTDTGGEEAEDPGPPEVDGGAGTEPPIAGCGDGVQGEDEECDGERWCTHACQQVECGNGRLDPGEECDPPGENCSSACRQVFCGNGRLDDPKEMCEPASVDTCTTDCSLIVCGDGVIEGLEECEPPQTVSCDSHCRIISCGNGVVDEGEGCDSALGSECSDHCRPLGCGDGEVTGYEECDPPTQGSCDANCLEVVCGNGRRETVEQCDPPDGATCTDTCRRIECGDGRVDAPAEECDPPDGLRCGGDCLLRDCGNGRLDEDERCEVAISEQPCSEFCTLLDVTSVRYIHDFESNLEGWALGVVSFAPDEGGSNVQFDADDGDPEMGCLAATFEFPAALQWASLRSTWHDAIDFDDAVLTARARLSGDQARGALSIRAFAKSGDEYDYVAGSWVPLTEEWVDVVLDPQLPALQPDDFDAADVREIGFEVYVPEAEGPTQATVHIDSVGLL